MTASYAVHRILMLLMLCTNLNIIINNTFSNGKIKLSSRNKTRVHTMGFISLRLAMWGVPTLSSPTRW